MPHCLAKNSVPRLLLIVFFPSFYPIKLLDLRLIAEHGVDKLDGRRLLSVERSRIREFEVATSLCEELSTTSIHGDNIKRFLLDVKGSRELVARDSFRSWKEPFF